MARIALLDNKGVTLIEMMMALVILLIVSLALMQTATLGIAINLQNALRDEAVNVAEMRMNHLTSLPFTSTVTHADLAPVIDFTESGIPRSFRGFSVNFTPTRTIADINANSKQITISISWDYRGKSYSHGITTIMRKQ